MMKLTGRLLRASVAAAALLPMACGSTAAVPGACPRPVVPAFDGVEHGAGLATRLEAALAALGDPAASTARLMELGLADPERSGQSPPESSRRCFGVMFTDPTGEYVELSTLTNDERTALIDGLK